MCDLEECHTKSPVTARSRGALIMDFSEGQPEPSVVLSCARQPSRNIQRSRSKLADGHFQVFGDLSGHNRWQVFVFAKSLLLGR